MSHAHGYDPPGLTPEPGGTPERMTAAAFIVERERLLLERRPDRPGLPAAGYRDIPGGHLRPGESPDAALVREMREELGIDLTRFRLGMVQDERDRSTARFYRHFVYIADAWSGDVEAREGQALEWVPVDRVSGLDRLNPLIGFAFDDFRRKGWL